MYMCVVFAVWAGCGGCVSSALCMCEGWVWIGAHVAIEYQEWGVEYMCKSDHVI